MSSRRKNPKNAKRTMKAVSKDNKSDNTQIHYEMKVSRIDFSGDY